MRFIGHSFAVVCGLLFGYSLVIALVAAFTTDSMGITAWFLGVALLGVAAVAATTTYVMRRPYSGGYVLVALVCIAATFVCFVSLIPLLAW